MSILKKLFFASLLILVVCLLFLGVYNLSFKKPAETVASQKDTPVATPPISTPIPPKTEIAKIAVVSDEAVLAPVLSPDGLSVKYYSKASGQAYQIDTDGTNKKTLSANDLSSLNSILWSPDKTKVISKFTDAGGNNQFSTYDYSAQKGFSLNKNITEAVWDNAGSKIFYVYSDPASKKSSLNISDPDGSNWKKLADLNYPNASVAPVPQSGLVSFWNKADSSAQTDLESVPVIGGDKKILFKEKFGADYLWSPTGNNILTSHSDAKGGSKIQLAALNYNGGEYSSLGIPTFVSKCAWSKNGKTLYYALPGNLTGSLILPNDYDSGKIKTSDTFWKIDLTTKQPARIAELADLQKLNIQFDASDLFLSSDESDLFFVNKLDGKLYKITL